MHRIDVPTATVDNLFSEGDPSLGVPATVVAADWLNDLQENICHLIEVSGEDLNKGVSEDLYNAIIRLTVGVNQGSEIANVAAISAVIPRYNNQIFLLKEYASGTGKGGGILYYDAGDTTTASNGGTVFVTSLGARLKRIFSGDPTGSMFGVVGTGDDSTAVTRMESSSFPLFNLENMTVTTGISSPLITKRYYNGTMLAQNSVIKHNRSSMRAEDLDITGGTKCHTLKWGGKNVLWLGTSIPADGGLGTYIYGQQRLLDSYPFLFAEAMGCNVQNFAWASSYAWFDKSVPAFTGIPVKPLSMTADDLAAMLSIHGPTSDYSDSIDAITKPSEMTADYRIKSQFASTSVGVVVLDHNHNDRAQLPGTLTPETITVLGITKGVTTQVTLGSIGTIGVGDGVSLSGNVGISKLNYASARVQSIAGSVVTLNINSSGYAGTFTSGSLTKLDRSTVYGAFEFLIRYIKNMSFVYGTGSVDIILCGAPSEYTGNSPDELIYTTSRRIKEVADKWGLSFYDVANDAKIQLADHIYYLPDGTHPTTYETRAALAAHWVRWASGGSVLKKAENAYLPAAIGTVLEQREPVYSKFYGGFATTSRFIMPAASLFTESFGGTLASWTVTGPATPSIVAAPWAGGGNALKVPVTSANTIGFISRAAAFSEGVLAEFDFQISTAAISSNPVGVCNVLVIAHPNTGSNYVLNLVKTSVDFYIQAETYTGLSNAGYTVTTLKKSLAAGTKYKIRLEAVRGDAQTNGSILLYVDDVLAGPVFRLADSAQVNGTTVYFGAAVFNNTGGTFDMYYGNIAVSKIDVKSMATRYTGNVVAGQTMTFVNGVLTAVS